MISPAARFASNLKRLRKTAGLSQENLAFAAGLHRTQVSHLEKGERLPRVMTLVRLSGALGVGPSDLLAGISWKPIVSLGGGLVVSDVEDGDGADET